jgi:hypothetical protein
MPSRILLCIGVVAGTLVVLSVASACNVPVFRYALERWRPDAYEVVVFHRGPLTAEQEKNIKTLRDAGEGRHLANLDVAIVDLADQPDEAMRRLWRSLQPRQLPLISPMDLPWSLVNLASPPAELALPWIVVRYPKVTRLSGAVWSGSLTSANVRAVIESPARKEIARRLMTGDSTVWLLVESGDADLDAAAEKLLKTELAKLEKSLKLPTEEDDPKTPTVALLSKLPLAIKFSVLRISRKDAAESVLRGMLMGAHEAVADAQGEPILFPVFGRGRALDAFVGKEINAEMLGNVASFLSGACSCTVKQLNPGVDLLFDAEWDKLIDADAKTETPPEPVKATPGEPVAIPQPSEQPLAALPAATPQATTSSYVWVIGGAFLLLLLVTGSVALNKNGKQSCETTP